MARVDFDQFAADYDRGRGIAPVGLEGWHAATAPLLSGVRAPILDLGAGSGQFAYAFAEWFGVPVVAVEPSAGMRRAARGNGPDSRVAIVGGTAGHLPLRDASCGAAWLSTVIHHIPDLAAAARDLRRVLQPGAPVLIRGSFPGRHDGISLFRYFPGAAAVARNFPTVEETAAAFASAGFAMRSLEAVPQQSAPDLAAVRERVMLRTDTTLRNLPESEFAAGLTAIDAALGRGEGGAPVVDHLDLLVLA
ncbi:MAG: class I SAM-dependent methyltransferase [Chloroflexi bacterium]|nr:class I SAM-dependent methyltransferase [Chloroflexota bacterium]